MVATVLRLLSVAYPQEPRKEQILNPLVNNGSCAKGNALCMAEEIKKLCLNLHRNARGILLGEGGRRSDAAASLD
jgi:hypothetical protein